MNENIVKLSDDELANVTAGLIKIEDFPAVDLSIQNIVKLPVDQLKTVMGGIPVDKPKTYIKKL